MSFVSRSNFNHRTHHSFVFYLYWSRCVGRANSRHGSKGAGGNGTQFVLAPGAGVRPWREPGLFPTYILFPSRVFVLLLTAAATSSVCVSYIPRSAVFASQRVCCFVVVLLLLLLEGTKRDFFRLLLPLLFATDATTTRTDTIYFFYRWLFAS